MIETRHDEERSIYQEQNAREISRAIHNAVEAYLNSNELDFDTTTHIRIERQQGAKECAARFFIQATREKISFIVDISDDEGQPVGTYQIAFLRDWTLLPKVAGSYSTRDRTPSVVVHPSYRENGIGKALFRTGDEVIEPILQKIRQRIPMKKATVITHDFTDPASTEAGWTTRRLLEEGKTPEMSGKVFRDIVFSD